MVELVETTGLTLDLGERATLLQFSSAFCAPCRATRRVLGDVPRRSPGVAHIEVDAEHHLDVVRRLGVLRTPTTLVLSARASRSPARPAPRARSRCWPLWMRPSGDLTVHDADGPFE